MSEKLRHRLLREFMSLAPLIRQLPEIQSWPHGTGYIEERTTVTVTHNGRSVSNGPVLDRWGIR